MAQRGKFHDILKTQLGSNNVYFQPPESMKIKYPAIVYESSVDQVKYANDDIYRLKKRYAVVVIDSDPDSKIPDKIAGLPFTKMNKRYTSNNLHHTSFTIYF